ncbi:MAG TPA: IclR family transcriptional regulator [Dehalococcoidales bacterium]|nr:IclR family transcriptional regulator [Dehalococcoidales bacterium]
MKKQAKIDHSWYMDMAAQRHSSNLQDLLPDADKHSTAVRSVFRSANILTCLSNGINTITDIAAACKLNKATVHRLLKALLESRLAMQDPTSHRYYLGYSIARIISNPYSTHEYLITCALKQMGRLSAQTGETVNLTILIGIQNVLLRDIPSSQELRVVEKGMDIRYVSSGATAKVLLSQLDKSKLEIALANLDLKVLTEDKKPTRESVMQQLHKIRQDGYCVSTGERISGATCLSVPVRNYVLPAALSIIGPDNRMLEQKNRYLKDLKAAGEKVENKITETFSLK